VSVPIIGRTCAFPPSPSRNTPSAQERFCPLLTQPEGVEAVNRAAHQRAGGTANSQCLRERARISPAGGIIRGESQAGMKPLKLAAELLLEEEGGYIGD
jgi:hypothetical protein